MILLVTLAAIVLLLGGVTLWLGRIQYISVPTAILRVASTTLGSNGWVDFRLSNNGNVDVTITRANATQEAGTSPIYLGSIAVATNNVVAAGGTLNLSVQFQSVTWQPGVTYDFVLISSSGNKFPTFAVG